MKSRRIASDNMFEVHCKYVRARAEYALHYSDNFINFITYLLPPTRSYYLSLITTVAAVSRFCTTRNALGSCCLRVGTVVREDNSFSDAGRQESRSVTAWKEKSDQQHHG